MKSKRKALIIIAIFTLLTIVDCYVTWLNTPDLLMEANPLIAVFGLGWTALIVSNLITLVLYAAVVYFAFVVYETPVIIAENKQELAEKLKKTEGKGFVFAAVGYSMAYSLIIARIFVVAEWLTIYFGADKSWLLAVRNFLPTRRPDLIIAVLIAIILVVFWVINEEKAKRKLAVITPIEDGETPLIEDV